MNRHFTSEAFGYGICSSHVENYKTTLLNDTFYHIMLLIVEA